MKKTRERLGKMKTCFCTTAKRLTVLFFCVLMAAAFLLPFAAPAETERKVIRVGWYDTPFNYKDAFDRRTGYAYEYQRKIAAYTGWKYEYVEGTWPELLQMLIDGRIDLMSDVSWTEERAEKMLYSAIPMGTELYYLYISPENTEISVQDYTTLNGKKVGVTGSSIQKGLFLDWAQERGIAPDLIELDCSEAESLSMLKRGELDAFVTLDSYGNPEISIPVWKIGSSDFYFAVNRERTDLLAELDMALSRIQDENKHYSEQLNIKYLQSAGTNRYLSVEECSWIADHGPIRVGFQDNYLAFCAADQDGNLTGALKDYLATAAGIPANAQVEFEAIVYPTASAAIEAVQSGEIDCMFPANLTDNDAEAAGLVMTPALMRTEMDAVVRTEDKQSFLRKSTVRVGVNLGNPNYEMFLKEHYPGWTPVFYTNTPACLDAVAEKNADCIIISNYRFNDIAAQCEKLNLTTVYTGVDMDYCLAVKEGNTTLYSILSKIISEVPAASVNAALTYYSTEPPKTGVMAYLQENPVVTALIVLCVALIAIIVILLVRFSPKREKEHNS